MDDYNRVQECKLETSPFENIAPNFLNVSKSICKINIESGLKIQGKGFLLKYNKNQEFFYCLISNEHVINNDIIHNNNIIYICYDSEFKKANLKLDKKKRYIKSFTDNGLDITVVEILEEDNISKDYFLLPETENIDNRLINSYIYIPQYANGKQLMNAKGKIKDIDNYKFTYLGSIEYGSSGSTIFLENHIKVIGIHKGSNKNKTENYADFIYPVINIIKNDISERNNDKYINKKYIWKDGKYYLGQFKNNLPNGKGIKYYSNGNIAYEGDFINGKFEGNGKYIYKNGNYFIGEWKNGLKNGKGTMYKSNGNILYEGDFINNKREGNGKYILENGEYYCRLQCYPSGQPTKQNSPD